MALNIDEKAILRKMLFSGFYSPKNTFRFAAVTHELLEAISLKSDEEVRADIAKFSGDESASLVYRKNKLLAELDEIQAKLEAESEKP